MSTLEYPNYSVSNPDRLRKRNKPHKSSFYKKGIYTNKRRQKKADFLKNYAVETEKRKNFALAKAYVAMEKNVT